MCQEYAAMHGGGGGKKTWFNTMYLLATTLSAQNRQWIQTLCQTLGEDFLNQGAMEVLRKELQSGKVPL
jgi:hypothetical protein